ncbi:MAG: Gfo/Idh/MocA family oxidoreductase [Pirellulales bacterium]
MTQSTRRTFLGQLSGVAAAAALPAWYLEQVLAAQEPSEPRSANDRPQIVLVGCGGRGTGVAQEAARFGQVIAVCDVDSSHAERAAGIFKGAKVYKDFRDAIDHPGVEIVVTGTPDHWHTFVNLRAVRAGKDVYSEKPLTLTIDEGKRLVSEVARTGRILQTGSQQRSDARFRFACELVRNGRLGKLSHVTTFLPAAPRQGPFQTAPVPAELDWEFWQGQAPAREFIPERSHVWFRFWWEYSAGTITDWGAHHNDIALWGMGLDRSGPTSVEGRALSEQVPGGFTTPSDYEIAFEYANGVQHTCKSVPGDRYDGSRRQPLGPGEFPNGVKFEGPEGWLFVTRGKMQASKPELIEAPLPSEAERLYASNNHMGNFFDCVRSRKAPVCEAEIGHRSVSVCHLGGIAIRLGRKLRWDPERQEFPDDQEANGYLTREQRKPWTYESV